MFFSLCLDVIYIAFSMTIAHAGGLENAAGMAL
jgi:hypothetical protein